jgi:chemotaxis signal transduction protein
VNAETNNQVPSFVVLQVGTRRIALPREGVAELIASPLIYTFPHTTPLIAGVVLRRGRILPVLDLGPGVSGALSPSTRFFLVVERRLSNAAEKCAIPVQGACELVSGVMAPAADLTGYVTGHLDLNGEQIEVLDLEKAIAFSASGHNEWIPGTEALS